ncbi:Rne/Rng family ribonuclease [Candidatus Neptunochlamydia vexilliferae]|nr:Rne/Rng family ribonuclease [Candidatus Neptunochlamydia vexilliferae]
MKEILLNVTSKEKRCAVLKFGKLQDLIVERKSNRLLTGNIYRGEVINILNNIQSAFIAINEGENGFIHISDIVENTQKFQEMFDMEFDWDCDVSAIKPRNLKNADISKFMEIGHPVLVQVVKEPIGSKGARLTSNITIPGRYLVLLPNTPHRGVSRKIIDRADRDRLKKIIRAFEMPQEMGLICRTASTGASTDELIAEAHELLENWEKIMEEFKESSEPTCLYRESDLVKKAVLKAVNKKYTRMLVDDYKTYQYCQQVYNRYKGEHELKLECYRDKIPMFDRFAVENEIERCLRRKIWLQSGGYLFFDKTEAMYTIDVNSGRSSSSKENTNVEETLVRINMEAAEEIARQLRIRNIGGLVICDFIDMRYRKNQRRVLDTLKEAMKEDSAKCTILGMSEFGLVEMTRQRTRESLIQTLFTNCPYCNGNGMIKNFESTSIEIERAIKRLISVENKQQLELVIHPQMNEFLGKGDRSALIKLAKKWKGELSFKTNDELHLAGFEFYSLDDGQKIE